MGKAGLDLASLKPETLGRRILHFTYRPPLVPPEVVYHHTTCTQQKDKAFFFYFCSKIGS